MQRRGPYCSSPFPRSYYILHMRHHTHHLFYGDVRVPGTVVLDKKETRHAVSVLRAAAGDTVLATDGRGNVYTCVIEELGDSGCSARIVDTRIEKPQSPALHVYAGLPERDAFEKLCENLVPFEIASITPVECAHCQARWWSSKWEKQADRFRRILIASLKQCLSPHLPAMSVPIGFGAALKSAPGACIFADAGGEKIAAIGKSLSGREPVSCFVGPPGGFSQDELDSLKHAGAHALWLGPHRLRTGLAAAAMVSAVRQAFA
ncbi:MAG: RsmE family RNA methyltransferase [Chitinivibrionales bacterium]|nr:RsmE family RNA methyltransferase [Chitinivibrionales bacterium]MBD3397407.1 RsmE family RNA methyltransferase [Chitinivibrionales bacterium]